MPGRHLPRNHAAILRVLVAARSGWKQFPADRLITAEHWAKLDDADPESLLSRYLAANAAVGHALAAQAPLTRASALALRNLKTHLSHFHKVFGLGVKRGVFPRAGRAFYGWDPGNATPPDLSTASAILLAGSRIAPGESARLAAPGHTGPAMALPSAAETAATHSAASAAHALSETAKLATDTAQNTANGLKAEARALALSLINTIEFHLTERTGLDAPGRRRIARAWGVVYTETARKKTDGGTD